VKSPKPATATCHVCRYNRDLACVEFRLKPTTRKSCTRAIYCSAATTAGKHFKKPSIYSKTESWSGPRTERSGFSLTEGIWIRQSPSVTQPKLTPISLPV
jgi:hypothetical protein